MHALNPRGDFHAAAQEFPRNGSRRDAPDCLAGGASAAAARVAQAVLGVVCEVGMRRTPKLCDFGVVLRVLVFVAHNNANGRPQRLALVDARKDFAGVGFVARRRERILTGSAPVELELNVVGRKLQHRRTAVDNAADRRAVALAESRYPENSAENASHLFYITHESRPRFKPIRASAPPFEQKKERPLARTPFNLLYYSNSETALRHSEIADDNSIFRRHLQTIKTGIFSKMGMLYRNGHTKQVAHR